MTSHANTFDIACNEPTFKIGNEVWVHVLMVDVEKNEVVLGIAAPKHIGIRRGERNEADLAQCQLRHLNAQMKAIQEKIHDLQKHDKPIVICEQISVTVKSTLHLPKRIALIRNQTRNEKRAANQPFKRK